MTLADKIPESTHGTSADGIENVLVPKEKWLDAARALAGELGFERFIDVTVVDWPEDEARFEVHLVVYSMSEKRWARLKTRTDGKLASLVGVYQGAFNYEREAFDLFGVVFEGHPKLTRIMLPDGWEGHPLRRDYEMPLEPTDFTVTRDLYKT